MRNAKVLTPALLLFGLLPGDAGAYTLTSRAHGFSIELPGEPDYHGKRIITVRDTEYDGLGWDQEKWSVHVLKLTPEMGGARIVSDIINEKSRCRNVESQKPIRQGGVAGREAFIRDTRWTHRHGCGFKRFTKRVRGFVVGDRFYWIAYKTRQGDALDPQVTRVFDSFRLLK